MRRVPATSNMPAFKRIFLRSESFTPGRSLHHRGRVDLHVLRGRGGSSSRSRSADPRRVASTARSSLEWIPRRRHPPASTCPGGRRAPAICFFAQINRKYLHDARLGGAWDCSTPRIGLITSARAPPAAFANQLLPIAWRGRRLFRRGSFQAGSAPISTLRQAVPERLQLRPLYGQQPKLVPEAWRPLEHHAVRNADLASSVSPRVRLISSLEGAAVCRARC